MFDLGWSELVLIGIVALIVVGPKDLPVMFRTVGNFVGKAKRMAREFSQAMNEAADEAGVDDLQKTLTSVTKPVQSAAEEMRKSTEGFTARTMAGPGKAELTPERADLAEKIRERSAEVARERIAREAEEAEEATAARSGVAAAASPSVAVPDEAGGGASARKTSKAKARTGTKARSTTAKSTGAASGAAAPRKTAPHKTAPRKSTKDKA